jgi:hypothetical protein
LCIFHHYYAFLTHAEIAAANRRPQPPSPDICCESPETISEKYKRLVKKTCYEDAEIAPANLIFDKFANHSYVQPIWEALDMSLKLVELEAKKRIHRRVPSRSITPPSLRGGKAGISKTLPIAFKENTF